MRAIYFAFTGYMPVGICPSMFLRFATRCFAICYPKEDEIWPFPREKSGNQSADKEREREGWGKGGREMNDRKSNRYNK